MEFADKIILLLSCMFEVYIFNDFFRAYFEYREHNRLAWIKALTSCVAVIGLFSINTYGNSYLNLFGAVTIIWLYFLILYNARLGVRLLYFTIAFLVGFGCEFLFGILLSIPLLIQEQNSVVNLSEIPWHMFSMKLLTFTILSVIKQYFGRSKKVVDNQLFAYYLCIPIASLGIMLLTYYSGVGATTTVVTKLLLCLCFALMLFGNIFVFQAFNRYSEALYTSAEQKLLISRQMMDLEYYSQVQKLDDKHRTFIHDISHYLKTIGELARENKNSNIISILQDLNIQLENSVLSIYCNNPVVNSILSEKLSIAERKGIPLDIYVEPGMGLLEISDADMITILGNLLDNALRAAENADEKSIQVRIYSDNEGFFHIIKISNSFNGNVVYTEQGFQTTKEEKGLHGIGIKSVEHTVEKYGGYLECMVEENCFTAIIMLPINE